MDLSTAQVARLRLQTQRLAGTGHSSPADAVRSLLAVQAQDLPAAHWALGVRVPGSVVADVTGALERGEVVRSWPLRGTLHLTAAEDLGWLLGITGERLLRGARTRSRELGIDDATHDRAGEVLTAALAGGRRLDREAALAVLADHGIDTSGQRGYRLLWVLAVSGVVCWGPPAGAADSHRAQHLVLRDEWIPAGRRLEGEEALAELAARYATGHGPVSADDLAFWAQIPLTAARRALAAAGDRLTTVTHDGAPLWMAATDADSLDPDAPVAKRSVLALPAFDEHLLGYRDRSAVIDPARAMRVVPGGNGMFRPTLVSAGRIVGTWRTPPRGPVHAELDAWDGLTTREAAGVARNLKAYARFWGRAG